ncbi:MAG: glycosyltransferase family 2 protein [Bacteroidetes bacterium]|nr:glycosyltransferase family 2 protein [Bacteroidota bacterium]
MPDPILHIALPVLDETATISAVLNCLFLQTVQDFRLYVCVNQPDEWWNEPSKRRICLENASLLNFLHSLKDERIVIIDRTSPGKGWLGKNHGIGWARKTLMDRISEVADKKDIIVSMDADTSFDPGFLESILSNVLVNPEVVGYSIPYYHRITGIEDLDRAMLRYEIYMRAYAINLWRIKSPYCFTALGSAIAVPVWAYRAIGGLTPKLSGEDFYFLQKLVKFGTILHWTTEQVYPAARLSERVYFGTGPALIKGLAGNWESYPIYNVEFFKPISEAYKLFPRLFEKDIPTPLDEFLACRSGGLPWAGIRKNSRSREQFIRACHEKIDGLRILQYLKEVDRKYPVPAELSTLELIAVIAEEQEIIPELEILPDFTFSGSSVKCLNAIRNTLARAEMSFRKRHWTQVSGLNAIFN